MTKYVKKGRASVLVPSSRQLYEDGTGRTYIRLKGRYVQMMWTGSNWIPKYRR